MDEFKSSRWTWVDSAKWGSAAVAIGSILATVLSASTAEAVASWSHEIGIVGGCIATVGITLAAVLRKK